MTGKITLSVHDELHNQLANGIKYDLWHIHNDTNRVNIKHDTLTNNDSQHVLLQANTVEELGSFEVILYIKDYFDSFNENIQVRDSRIIVPFGMHELDRDYQLNIFITPTNKMDSSTNSPRVSTTSVPIVISIDGHNWSYWAFVWLGLGSLLPINFFITADPYFRYKLHDSKISNSSVSRLELSYENAVMLCASVPNLIATILVTFICVPYIHKYRIYTSLSGIAICLLICFALIFVNVSQWREIFFIVTMILVMIQGVFCAILLNCFFSLASTLPSQYIQGNIL
ncbi:unnamed protein product [Rotaria sp. Silwood2]|nr:unnamed protein product [Rotaria sp. Silwood2]CAF3264789.1 unnamed protein product [Rotaria sp. Silwood2]CAF4724502.1 unnamed protein product [Rotaria sp. Silwood2]